MNWRSFPKKKIASRWVSAPGPYSAEGKRVAVQGIARDITKSKKTEAALQEANQKLEAWVNELEQRTREMTLLNDMGDILRACLSTEEAYKSSSGWRSRFFPCRSELFMSSLLRATSWKPLPSGAILHWRNAYFLRRNAGRCAGAGLIGLRIPGPV